MKRLLTCPDCLCCWLPVPPPAPRPPPTARSRPTPTRPTPTAAPAIRLELAQGYFSRGQFADGAGRTQARAAGQARHARGREPARPHLCRPWAITSSPRRAFRRALAVYPNDPDTLHNYGWFLCQQQRWPTADSLFDQARGPVHLPRTGPHAAGQGRLRGPRRPPAGGREDAVTRLRAGPGQPRRSP